MASIIYLLTLKIYLERTFSYRAEENATKRRDKIRKIKRYASVGVATIAGGTLIGLTGGLAAPFIGVGVGTILGGASAAAIASTTGIAIIGSIFGVAGAGLTGCYEFLSKSCSLRGKFLFCITRRKKNLDFIDRSKLKLHLMMKQGTK